mgnify:FL=1
MRLSLSTLGFLRWGWTEQLLNWSGKTPVEIDRLIILVSVGRRIWEHCLRSEVGIGSKSQLVSGDWERSLETSSAVTLVKDEKEGGVNGGGWCGEVQEWWERRLVWSLWILSEKNVAKDWDKGLREVKEGRTGGEERWRILLTFFQSWRGLVRLDEMRVEFCRC